MKKAIALVGAGALVLTLGLGSGFAQQTVSPPAATPPTAVQPKAPAAEGVNKDILLPAKPTTSTGTETAVKPAADKPAEKGAAVKPGEEPKVDKAATMPKAMEKSTDAKGEQTPTGPAGKETNKALLEQAPAAKTGQTAVPEKSGVEKSADKKEEAKPVVKQ